MHFGATNQTNSEDGLTAPGKLSMLPPCLLFGLFGQPRMSQNRVDTEVMLGMADESSHRITLEPENADVIVVNTCGFIGAAKEESVDTILEMAEFKRPVAVAGWR